MVAPIFENRYFLIYWWVYFAVLSFVFNVQVVVSTFVGIWLNHLPPACWSTFWKSNFKQQFGCRFDIMDINPIFCVLTYAIIFVLIHQIIFRFYLLIHQWTSSFDWFRGTSGAEWSGTQGREVVGFLSITSLPDVRLRSGSGQLEDKYYSFVSIQAVFYSDKNWIECMCLYTILMSRTSFPYGGENVTCRVMFIFE